MINLSCAMKKMQEIAFYTRSSKATKASHHATPIIAVKQNPAALKLIALGVFSWQKTISSLKKEVYLVMHNRKIVATALKLESTEYEIISCSP